MRIYIYIHTSLYMCIYIYIMYTYIYLCTLRCIERLNFGSVILVLGNAQCIKLPIGPCQYLISKWVTPRLSWNPDVGTLVGSQCHHCRMCFTDSQIHEEMSIQICKALAQLCLSVCKPH